LQGRLVVRVLCNYTLDTRTKVDTGVYGNKPDTDADPIGRVASIHDILENRLDPGEGNRIHRGVATGDEIILIVRGLPVVILVVWGFRNAVPYFLNAVCKCHEGRLVNFFAETILKVPKRLRRLCE
jgi:hypothetical protein